MARRRTTLSQNFLRQPTVVHRIVRAAAPSPDELVLEPGAGQGALTRPLADNCRRVIAYEVDPRLGARLAAQTRDHPGIRLVRKDFVRVGPPHQPFAVVGNIPFSRTNDIVRWCLGAPSLTSATLLTQLEYGLKRTGGYGRWSLLTVRSWPEHEWRFLFRVARSAFEPTPRTDAALLRVERRTEPLIPMERLAAYREFVERGFTGVGGSVAATLSRRYGTRRVRAVCRAQSLDGSMPAGFVHPEQWLELFREFD